MAKKKSNSGVLNHRITVKSYQLVVFLLLFGGIGVYSLLFSFADSANKGGGGAHPPHGTTSSLTYNVTIDNNSNGVANWGDTLRFNPVTNATDAPYVELLCSQNGTIVYSANAGYFDSYAWPWTQNMQLSSNAWTGGAADCVARMFMITSKGKTGTTTLATLSFQAQP